VRERSGRKSEEASEKREERVEREEKGNEPERDTEERDRGERDSARLRKEKDPHFLSSLHLKGVSLPGIFETRVKVLARRQIDSLPRVDRDSSEYAPSQSERGHRREEALTSDDVSKRKSSDLNLF
jgi:hypothetical protein